MKKYNISTNLIQVIKNLYDKATSTVLFNIFLERIMTDAFEDREGTVSIGGRTITNLRFANDIDGLTGEEEELANLLERLDKASTGYGMEISAEKTKLMTNNTSGINTEIKVNGHEDLLAIVKRCKLQWYGHVSRSSGLAETILEGTAKGGRRQGRQRKIGEDNIREWTDLKLEKTGCEIICGTPTTLAVKG